jgi:hypothetical protein
MNDRGVLQQCASHCIAHRGMHVCSEHLLQLARATYSAIQSSSTTASSAMRSAYSQTYYCRKHLKVMASILFAVDIIQTNDGL